MTRQTQRIRVGRRVWVLLLAAVGCAHEESPGGRQKGIDDLERRIALLESNKAKVAQPPTLPEGPVATRAAKLRAAADLLEKADEAKRQGDSAGARDFFDAAAAEGGSTPFADLEPLFRSSSQASSPPSPAAPPAAESVAAKASSPAATRSRPRAASRERASLEGSTALSGPFASAGGMGAALLTPLFAKMAAQPRHVVMEQRNRTFTPYVLPAPIGSTVSFPNRDPVYHNIFSLSDAKSFDLGVYKDGESRDVVFDRAGVVRILCNLHATMTAYVVVHEEPFSAVIDKSGHFSFKDLQPGKYRLRAWHERAQQAVTREVTLEPGANQVELPVTADVAPSLGPNKQGRSRDRESPPY